MTPSDRRLSDEEICWYLAYGEDNAVTPMERLARDLLEARRLLRLVGSGRTVHDEVRAFLGMEEP